jgi:hypothetical protein
MESEVGDTRIYFTSSVLLVLSSTWHVALSIQHNPTIMNLSLVVNISEVMTTNLVRVAGKSCNSISSLLLSI